MNMLQALVNNASGRSGEQLHFVAARTENFHNKPEMYRQHIGYKNGVGLFHFGGKFCIGQRKSTPLRGKINFNYLKFEINVITGRHLHLFPNTHLLLAPIYIRCRPNYKHTLLEYSCNRLRLYLHIDRNHNYNTTLTYESLL